MDYTPRFYVAVWHGEQHSIAHIVDTEKDQDNNPIIVTRNLDKAREACDLLNILDGE